MVLDEGPNLGPIYWPVFWDNGEGDESHLAYFDGPEMARHIAGMLSLAGLNAETFPPVRLKLFNTFLSSPAQ